MPLIRAVLGRSALMWLGLVVITAAAFTVPVILAPLRSDDELGALRVGEQIIWAIAHAAPKDAFAALVWSDQPPLRNVISLPLMLVLGPSELALRLPHAVFWVGCAVLIYVIAQRYAGTTAATFAGLLTGASGLFDFQALGLAMGISTFWLLSLVCLLVRHPIAPLSARGATRRYVIGATFCVMAFITFTSALPIVVTYHGIYAWLTMRAAPSKLAGFRAWSRATWPFAALYLAYALVFLGFPYYMYASGKESLLIGQLAHVVGRSSGSSLHVGAFVEDLQGMNGYFLPFVSWVVFVTGVAYLWTRCREAVVILTGSALLLSFYLEGHTAFHFLPLFTVSIAPAVAALWGRFGRRTAIAVSSAALLLVVAWGVAIHIWPYSEDDYPRALLRDTFSLTGWINNVPYQGIAVARDVAGVLGKDEVALSFAERNIDYYLPDHGRLFDLAAELQLWSPASNTFVRRPEGCLTFRDPPDPKVRAVITVDPSERICDALVARRITYPGSSYHLEILR